MTATKTIPGPYHTVTEIFASGTLRRVSICARDQHGEFQIATMNLRGNEAADKAAEATAALLASSSALAGALICLRAEVMHDCNASSASAERYADILKHVDAVLAKAGVI
jgi:hypothetical protein